MDYYEIGQRIRKYRKACDMSQEHLAELVGISTTHLSHIETGNTKLSLPVLVSIAQHLSVRTDELIFNVVPYNKSTIKNEINELLDTCSEKNASIIKEVVKTTKIALEKYDEK